MANINKHVHEYAKDKFEEMLLAGHFPEVQFKKERGCTSMMMMEYSLIWQKYTKLIHERMIQAGYGNGIWQNARSSKFVSDMTTVVNGVSAEDIKNSSSRFKGWMD